ncbi:two component transcriptional regulator, LytTR family [Lachnospiraceae bacterium C7]|nr:two component transcriptional regulator, LytTR family [Lachnospiraceae bacterium C7]
MRVAIVDDSLSELNDLSKYLRTFSQETKESMTVDKYEDGNVFLKNYSNQYDLVLLDIDMPKISGIDVARKLREMNEDVVLMFVTAMTQYALAGFEVDAIDYVIKPVSYPDFALKLKKAKRYIEMNRNDTPLLLQTKEGIINISVKDVLYVESALHYCIYHTSDKEYKVRENISSAEQKLAPYHFARCNAGYLVALKHVESIVKDEVYVGDYVLKISRGKKTKFIEQFTRVLGGL